MSYYCHSCGTVIEEDEDTLCGACKKLPPIQTFYVIKRDKRPAYWNSLAMCWVYPLYTYNDRHQAELVKEDVLNHLIGAKQRKEMTDARIVKVMVSEVGE